MLSQGDRCVVTRGPLSCHKRTVVSPQEDLLKTCFAHNSCHRILLETLSTDLVSSLSRRTQIRPPNTPKPIQKPPKPPTTSKNQLATQDKHTRTTPTVCRSVAARGTFSETCFAHNSAHRILPEKLYPDQSISFSIRTRSRQQNIPKPIQKPPKTTFHRLPL